MKVIIPQTSECKFPKSSTKATHLWWILLHFYMGIVPTAKAIVFHKNKQKQRLTRWYVDRFWEPIEL